MCLANELRRLCYWAGGDCSPPPREQERGQGRYLKPFLSFSSSSALFLPGSLTSLIYGEQSEKTSPSDISLEMEHKDKVSAGREGAGPEGRGREGRGREGAGQGAGPGQTALPAVCRLPSQPDPTTSSNVTWTNSSALASLRFPIGNMELLTILMS